MADTATPLLVDEGDDELEQAEAWRGVETVEISCDILVAARQLLQLLRRVHTHPCLYQGPAVARAIHRYELCWLPLAARQSADSLAKLLPPLDVEWIWLCHRLAPVSYLEDSERVVGVCIDGPLQNPEEFDEKAAGETTRGLWEAAYPSEPYAPNLEQWSEEPSTSAGGLSHDSKIGYDLAASALRQSTFFHQVDRPWMAHSGYMQGSLQRYRLFLNLLRRYRGTFCVPTYDVDLLWHAHMMCCGTYHRDCLALLGRLLDHDDSDGERGAGKRLEMGFRATATLWDKAYGVPYDRAGAMYRGPQPNRVLPPPGMPPLTSRLTPFSLRKAEWQLDARFVFKAHLMVWAVAGLPHHMDQHLLVRVRPLAAAASTQMETRGRPFAKGWPLPVWKQRWALECEQASRGLLLDLVAEPTSWLGQLWGPRVLGSAELEWGTVQQQSSLFLDTHLTLSGFSLFGQPERPLCLHVTVSATPSTQGPYLLRTVFMRATDDSGGMVCEDVVLRQGLRPQPGRWVSRTVYDHADKEVFVVRKRVASGVWTCDQRPVAVLPKERVIVVQQGGWEYCDADFHDDFIDSLEVDPPHCRTGYAKGEVLGQAVPQPSPDSGSCQRFALIGQGEQFGILEINRDKQRSKWIESIQLTFEDDSAIPTRLLLGRHGRYTVPTAPASEDHGFVTLLRYSHSHSQGVATALFNWRGSTLECAPAENPLLVLLLLVAFTEGLHEMEGVDRVKPFCRVRLPYPDPTLQWDAAVVHRTCLSAPLDSNEPPTAQAAEDTFSFSSVESEAVFWWNKGALVRSAGAGACGAGACGPSIYDGSPLELHGKREQRV